MKFIRRLIIACQVWKQEHIPPLVIDGSIIALLIALGFGVMSAYRAFGGHRADQSLDAAKAAAGRGDWTTARDQADNVLQMRQDDFEARCIWAQALAKLGDPLACAAATKLVSDPRTTCENRLQALQVVLAQAPQAVVLDLYHNLPQALTAQAAFRAAITPLRIQRNENELAEKELREAIQPGDSPDVQLALLRLLCSRPSAERVDEARHIFAELVATNASDEALAALPLLGAVPGGLRAEAPLPDLPAWLKQQTKATASHHLLGINPALEAQPETADHWYQIAIERFLMTDPGPLGDWLIQHGQAEKAAKILEKPAKSSPDAYLARLHALLVLKQLPAIKQDLRRPPAAVDLVEIEIIRAKFALQSGDPISAHAAWNRALNHAAFETSRNRCIDIARSATDYHAKDAAEDAWVAAIRLGRGPLPLYQDLLPVYDSLVSQGRSEDLLAMFQVLERLEPANCELKNRACYLRLIHSIESPAQVAAAVSKLLEQNDNAPFHVTLMLAEMLDGRGTDALTHLPKLSDNKGVAPMMLTALEGTARVLAGQTEAGTRLVKGVDWHGFMPQERSVFRDLLVKHKFTELPISDSESRKSEAAPAQVPTRSNTVGTIDKEQGVLPPLPPSLVR